MSTLVPTSPMAIRRAAWSVAAVFAINGMGFATWSSRIPAIKQDLGLDPAGLGALLMCVSVGAMVGLPVAGAITSRIGARRTILAGLATFTVGLALLGLSVEMLGSTIAAGAAFLVLGVGVGLWDVAMNVEGAAVERQLGRAVMPRFHAAFSGGTVLMASVAAGLAYLGVSAGVHFLATAALWPIAGWLAVRGLQPHRPEQRAERDATRGGAASAWAEPRTLLIGVVVLIAGLTEGTANDWVSVALVDGYDLPEWAGVLGLTAFLATMTAGRLAGTWALDTYGRVPVLRALFVLAALGSALVVFGGPALAFAGAAAWGLGASLGFPVGMSAAADDPRRAPARVSTVSTIGYLAFLGGPPLLGLLGNRVGVLHSLLVVGALALLALMLAPVTREPPAAAPGDAEHGGSAQDAPRRTCALPAASACEP